MTLGTGDRLGFPINGEVRQVIASLGLIPVILEGGTDQVDSIALPTLDEIGRINVAGIDQVLLGEQVLLGQGGMNPAESLLVVDGSRGGLDMGDQLRGIFMRLVWVKCTLYPTHNVVRFLP